MSTSVLGAPLDSTVVVQQSTPRQVCQAYVNEHPAATACHQPEWLDVIERAFGHQTLYLSAWNGRAIVGVLPLVFFANRAFGRFAVSMPFLNYGGILADTPAGEDALLHAAVAETRRQGGTHLELRHVRRHFPELAAKQHKVRMTLPLAKTEAEQWSGLDRKIRNQVRKAEKSGLSVSIGGMELLDSFYDVFAHNMRDLGTPVYARRFFAEVLTCFPDASRLLVVALGTRPVAAALVYWHRDTIEVPWASSLREFNALCPNVLLYWHMLRFGAERGLGVFDFGRSTPGEGTFLFKKQWGAQPTDMVWEYWTADGKVPDMSPKNPKLALAVRAWQKLPVSVATALGPHIVRHIP